MKRPVTLAVFAAVLAAGMAAYWFGMMPDQTRIVRVGEAPIYYRDPDGQPAYSATPRHTPGGKAYVPVYQGDDKVSFAGAAKAGADEGRKIKFYRNPMGLPDTSPVPKKDSMGMDYIPVYEGETEERGVRISLGKIQRSGVKSEPASMRAIRTMIRAPGTVQLDERRVTVVSMRSESWVQKVGDITTGSRVRKGEPMMEIYSPAITSAAAEYVAIRATDSTGTLSAGARQRLMNLNVPESALASIEKARGAPLAITWTAPRDGIVLERNATEGMRVGAGDVLFRVADISMVWTLIDVAERDLTALKVGMPAAVRARAFPGKLFEGNVSVIYPQINKDTRTVRVRLELANQEFALLPDMYVDAEISAGKDEQVLAVPDSAVLDSGSRQVVFVDKGDGRFEPRDVKPGARGGGYTEIRSGLADGEAVVTAATFLVDAESNLNAAIQSFTEPGGGR